MEPVASSKPGEFLADRIVAKIHAVFPGEYQIVIKVFSPVTPCSFFLLHPILPQELTDPYPTAR